MSIAMLVVVVNFTSSGPDTVKRDLYLHPITLVTSEKLFSGVILYLTHFTSLESILFLSYYTSVFK